MTQLQQIEKQIQQKKQELENVKGTECSVYTRIVGYYRPLKQFNDGQAAQYKERKLYNITGKELKG